MSRTSSPNTQADRGAWKNEKYIKAEFFHETKKFDTYEDFLDYLYEQSLKDCVLVACIELEPLKYQMKFEKDK